MVAVHQSAQPPERGQGADENEDAPLYRGIATTLKGAERALWKVTDWTTDTGPLALDMDTTGRDLVRSKVLAVVVTNARGDACILDWRRALDREEVGEWGALLRRALSH